MSLPPTQTLNRYTGTWNKNDTMSVVAPDMETAALVLNSAKSSDPVLLQRVEEGIQVQMPELNVRFVAGLSDQAAFVAGCRVAPRTYVRPAGTEQVFTCILVDGWNFVKWQIDGVDVTGPEGTERIALLTIPASSTTVNITAVVTP